MAFGRSVHRHVPDDLDASILSYSEFPKPVCQSTWRHIPNEWVLHRQHGQDINTDKGTVAPVLSAPPDGAISVAVLKLHTKWTGGQFRNLVALPPEKKLPVRHEQKAAWAARPVLALVDNYSVQNLLSSSLLSKKLKIKIYTRVGTSIVATIYLQLIQNRYMFRSFTVLQCSHQHCVQPVASDVEIVGYL